MTAKYTALDIAHWFTANIDRDAGDSITHLKLQKLVYYAQAWALALLERPLFDEDMQAWAHGPVAESVYHEFKVHSWGALPAPESVPDMEADDVEHLHSILSVYGDFSAKHLEAMTHAESPWREARGDIPPEARSTAIIPKPHMAEFYASLYAKADASDAA